MTLINIFDLLQSPVSGVVTCEHKRNHAINGINLFLSRLIWFFQVVGWRTGIQYLKGKYRRPYLCRLPTAWLFLVKTQES